MVARADGDAEAVEKRAEVERMNIADIKGHDGVFVGRRAVKVHIFNGTKAFHGILCQTTLVGGDFVHSERLDIINGGRQGVRSDVIRRTGFEL